MNLRILVILLWVRNPNTNVKTYKVELFSFLSQYKRLEGKSCRSSRWRRSVLKTTQLIQWPSEYVLLHLLYSGLIYLALYAEVSFCWTTKNRCVLCICCNSSVDFSFLYYCACFYAPVYGPIHNVTHASTLMTSS